MREFTAANAIIFNRENGYAYTCHVKEWNNALAVTAESAVIAGTFTTEDPIYNIAVLVVQESDRRVVHAVHTRPRTKVKKGPDDNTYSTSVQSRRFQKTLKTESSFQTYSVWRIWIRGTLPISAAPCETQKRALLGGAIST